MKNSLAAAAMLCVMSFPSQAQSFAAHGIGVQDSCGSFTSALKKHGPGVMWKMRDGEMLGTMSYTYMSWVLGFVTATNLVRPEKGQIMTDREGIAGWLNKYCEQHPELTISEATIELVRALPAGFQ
ncbi:hypothetical protein [Achromobacter denitrificans]|uniref:hypothetical protein n=1 Tax=Achromobacter denitrificans TaxID=32002 RepID=UPI003B9AB214